MIRFRLNTTIDVNLRLGLTSPSEGGFLQNTTTVVNDIAKLRCVQVREFSSNMTSVHSIKIMSITVVIKWDIETEAIISHHMISNRCPSIECDGSV